MNNLNNLYPCLRSIKEYTSVTYEVIIVAYLFSKANLEKLEYDFPWVKIIESTGIRGFSENNNLALKQANGKYIFILNDDTFFNSPVIDDLLKSFKLTNNATIMSPDIRYPDNSYQICGRRKYDWLYWIVASFEMERYIYRKSQYENQKGIFQTYNISGAAFMIKNDFFRDIGFFDEIYFFSPEDIALSTLINKMGLKCYVDETIKLYHVASSTSSKIQQATMPSHTMGSLIFFANNNLIIHYILAIIVFSVRGAKMFYALIRSLFDSKFKILYKANLNTCKIIFSKQTPKEIFLKFYSEIHS